MIKIKRYKISLIVCGILFSFVLSNSASTTTYQTGVKVKFTFNPTLSIDLSSNNIMINNLAPGASGESDAITVTVNTNSLYGYTLNATVGQVTSYETRNLVKTGTADAFTSLNFSDSLASLTTDNTWGYSFRTSASGASWSNYSGLPLYSDTTNIATLIDTDEPADSDSIQFKIGAKASLGQPAGEYRNVINFIAVSNPGPHLEPIACEAGMICYNVNSLDPTEGTMGKQSASDNATVTLLASNFSRENYGFAGWSDVYDYETNPSAHFYGPNESVTAPTGTTANGWSLYAVWVPSEGYMQIEGAEVCYSLTQAPNDGTANLSSVAALTDLRDNNTYAVAKLADGKCWMIENLRLDDTARFNSDGALAQGYGLSSTYGDFSGLAAPETLDKFSSTYSANTLYSNDGSNGTINIGTSDAAYRMPRYNNVNIPANASDRPQNPTSNSATNSNSNAGMYSYGNYYSWHAAIAYLMPFTTNNDSAIDSSLCPKGWHMPTGGGAYPSGSTTGVNVTGAVYTYRDFYYLSYKLMDEIKTAYEDTPGSNNRSYYSSGNNTTNLAGDTAMMAFRRYPNNFVYAGYVTGSGSILGRGTTASYWSSTAADSNYAYGSFSGSTLVYPGTNANVKYLGRAIRCISSY